MSISVCLVVSAALSCLAGVPLVENGRAVGVIVHNGHTAVAPQIPVAPLGVNRGVVKPAVEELRDYLKQITGVELPLVTSPEEAGGRPAIVFGIVDQVTGAGDRETGVQAYRLRTEGNRLTIAAAEVLGLQNAVYGLLEDHLGCRFYSLKKRRGGHGASYYEGPGYEIVPKRPTLTLGDIDDLQEPSFASRGLIFAMGSYPWVLKNRGIDRGDHVSGARASGHTMYHIIPPQDRSHAKGLFAEHPEIYPLGKDGKRHPDTFNQGICGTAQALPQILAERIKHAPIKDGFAAVGQGDGFQRCWCPECRKLVHEQQSEAAPTILALNRALEILGKTDPDLKIITFCYFDSLDAPKTLKPHPNL